MLTISEASARLQKSLIDFAVLFSIDILLISKVVFDRKSSRDQNRFDKLFDPTLSYCLKDFQKLQKQTYCVYASNAKLWGASKYNTKKGFEDNMFIYLQQLLRFTKIAPAEHLDGFIIELPTTKFGANLEMLANTMNNVLRYLNKNDPKQSNCLDIEIESKSWQFNFNGIDLFFVTFAPFYPDSNPRKSISDKTFIFVQLQQMFKEKIPRDRVTEVKKPIRTLFNNGNKDYDGIIMDNDFEAYKFVKPISLSGDAVKWWKM